MLTQKSRNLPRSAPGFALIIALSLMAMIVLLTVSLSTMVQVELAASSHRNSEDIARQNALFGMQVALGQLQQFTGPDQSITAPATSVFPNENTSPTLLSLHKSHAEERTPDPLATEGFFTVLSQQGREDFDDAVKTWWEDKNPHWIGVWDSRRTNGKSDETQLPKWIISGNERFNGNLATEYPAEYLTPDMDAATLNNQFGEENLVYLVDEGSAVSLSETIDGYDGRVRALKQAVMDSDGLSTGNYAYWVGDESLKANFAVRDPYYEETNRSSREYRNRLRSPQRVGWENITGFEIVGSSSSAPSPNDPRLEMLGSSSQISLLDETGSLVDSVRQNFHSLTAYSKSLLTDPVSGGLKKDLTVYFDKGASATNGFISDNNPIPDPDGNDVWDYGNDERMGSNNQGFPNSDVNIPTWGQLKDWYDNQGTDTSAIDVGGEFAPLVTYIRMFVGFSAEDTLTGGKRVNMHLLPTIVVWNPYDAPLKNTTYELTISYPMEFQHFMAATPYNQVGDTSTGGQIMYVDTVTGLPCAEGAANAEARYFVHELEFLLNDASDDDTALREGNGDGYYYDQPMYSFTPWNDNAQTEFVLRFSASFEPGENLIFSVIDNTEVSLANDGKIYIDVENGFYDEQPSSAYLPIFNVKNTPNSGADMYWISGLDGLNHYYGVELQKSGETLYDAEEFGYMQTPYVQCNIINGRDENLINTPSEYDKNQRLANNISDWRKLYDFDDSTDGEGGEFTNLIGSTIDNKSAQTNDMDSPIFALGHSYLTPFGTTYAFSFDHHRYVDQMFRHMATHNLNARYPSVHPLNDAPRGIFGQNNNDGFGRFKYGMGTPIEQWKTPQHIGLPWDDNLSQYDESRDIFNGSSLMSFRFPLPESTDVAGASYLPMRNIRRPDAELVSLGQLQQVNLSPFLWQPAFPIGNSEASPYVDRELMAGIENHAIYAKKSEGLQTFPNDNENMMVDMSYLLNDSLWDHYFLSTIPQTGSIDISGDPTWPNSRHRINSLAVTESDLRDFDTAAAHIYNVGAFNVNSTSVEAWKSLLTAFRDLKLGESSSQTNPDQTVPVSRTLNPLDEPINFVFSESNTTPTDFGAVSTLRDYYQLLAGYRYLDDAMIQELAERIVDEVRLRGPFLSMSDFVNRELVSPDRTGGSDAWLHARQNNANPRESYLLGHISNAYDPMVGINGINGALQRAINLSGINGGVNYPQDATSGAELSTRNIDRAYGLWPTPPTAHKHTANFYNIDSSLNYYVDMEHVAGAPAGEYGQLMSHLPGFVTQADLLSMIGPALTVRGDTFVIRSYGDSINKLTGEVTSRAWLEAVVQRMVEPIVDTDGDYEPDDGATNVGRRYQIIALRWLNEDEV
ncbi:pilus assembly PilX family protein [Cerasicoccus maritimus]|uniref:pilus assembly PilX family protein n=1 Tax=Cerasicoccus maritimus TaxID=490089 RepID=UPI002852C2E4|nr:hypothetical protein [Cerasicoccus maritimus]